MRHKKRRKIIQAPLVQYHKSPSSAQPLSQVRAADTCAYVSASRRLIRAATSSAGAGDWPNNIVGANSSKIAAKNFNLFIVVSPKARIGTQPPR